MASTSHDNGNNGGERLVTSTGRKSTDARSGGNDLQLAMTISRQDTADMDVFASTGIHSLLRQLNEEESLCLNDEDIEEYASVFRGAHDSDLRLIRNRRPWTRWNAETEGVPEYIVRPLKRRLGVVDADDYDDDNAEHHHNWRRWAIGTFNQPSLVSLCLLHVKVLVVVMNVLVLRRWAIGTFNQPSLVSLWLLHVIVLVVGMNVLVLRRWAIGTFNCVRFYYIRITCFVFATKHSHFISAFLRAGPALVAIVLLIIVMSVSSLQEGFVPGNHKAGRAAATSAGGGVAVKKGGNGEDGNGEDGGEAGEFFVCSVLVDSGGGAISFEAGILGAFIAGCALISTASVLEHVMFKDLRFRSDYLKQLMQEITTVGWVAVLSFFFAMLEKNHSTWHAHILETVEVYDKLIA
jgi:hypothetical protein